MKSDYQRFEDVHRGSRDAIIERLKFYLPYVLPLKEVYEAPKALDLGCGRGEWLQLMHEHGIDAYGVDADEGMLAQTPTEVATTTGDLLEYLKAQKDASFICVSCFHVIEHIDIDIAPELIAESKRTLVPGGLLIIETPNSENISVGTDKFYTDPTHLKPVSKLLLFHHCEKMKFKNIKILGVNNIVTGNAAPSISKIVYGVSPDFAIIAQTDAPYEVLRRNHETLSKDVGTTLEKVVSEFDNELNDITTKQSSQIDLLEVKTAENKELLFQLEDTVKRLFDEMATSISSTITSNIEKKCSTLENSIHVLQEKIEKAEGKETSEPHIKISSMEADIANLKDSIHEKEQCIEWLDNEWHEALRERDHHKQATQDLERKLAEQYHTQEKLQHRKDGLQKKLDAVYQSWSWRLSLPLRLPGKLWRSFGSMLRWLLAKGIRFALNNRLITLAFLKILGPFPKFRERLNSFYQTSIRNPHSSRDEKPGLPPETNEDQAHFYSLLIKEVSRK